MKENPWKGKPGAALILEVLVREEMKSGVTDEKAAKKLAIGILRILYEDIRDWKSMFSSGRYNFARMTPAEHEKAVSEVSQCARQLKEALTALNLPANPLGYYPELWPEYSDIETLLTWREAGTRIDTWLNVLADRDRVSKVAPNNPLSKVAVKNPELSYTVRMCAQHFHTHYGKTLPTTIERVCSIEFPDADVSKNTITSILRNFDLEKKL